jgi:hypothetical protein
VGSVLRYGATVALKRLASPYHAPVHPSVTCEEEGPAENTSSAPNWEEMFVAANDWKDAMALEAAVMLRLSQPYWKTMAEAGAGNVCTSMEVTIPNEGDAPRIA